ncbi:MAG: SDR family NAD(P)-dependent oxidoreductase [Ardenticatenaceae bacterium]|nr:SDR family NAD(P)-dependent oxidoreductase [Anaerolineales bacterium]MCB8923430.1 SDR family NAD(P)-dependent oxidoreductase [Ardenticatenaceae bacterium]MCB8991415.1 SDR family NAD(P)-dependent oxidoreductase [Ardenticatenaceae bacterium]MCB9003845.1 SDR family NAD(P)-dependent oxidoreductase [Ardenticatenaceae bacterium]
MKVLVTGAAGFIGSHLAEKLAKRGDEVVGIDNFNDVVYPSSHKRHAVKRLAAYDNIRIIETDIRDREGMFALFAAEKFDAVAHLAALAGVRNAVKYPALYVEVDLNGTQNLMDAALEHKVGNFVFASTSSVYGNTTVIPFVETDNCDRPLQPYAAAKRAAEMLGHSYHHLFGLNFTVLRFFTVYGPYGRPDMMAYLLAESVTKGLQIPLYEGGQMYRDWTFINDITSGIALALDKPLGYEIINIGRGEPTLLADFVHMIEDLAGNKANVVHKPKLAADFVRNQADITKARTLLGYDPQTSVKEGVRIFWEWYASREA